MVKFRMRKSFNVLPFLRLNVTQSGAKSWTWHAFGYSYNTRTQKHRYNTPGPGSVEWGGRNGRRSR